MKKYREVSIILCAVAVCALFSYVFAAGIFPNQAYAIGAWCQYSGYGVWQYEDYQNTFRIKFYAVNPYPNSWVVAWRVTTNKYSFWVGNSLSVNMEEDAGTQEAWFDICNLYSTTQEPISLTVGCMWIRIDIARTTNHAVIQYYAGWGVGGGTLWQADNAKYMNGTWEICVKNWQSQSNGQIDFYFTPQKVQSQAELVYSWTGNYAGYWLYLWWYNAGTQGYIYTGCSNHGADSGWRYFSNVIVGTRIL